MRPKPSKIFWLGWAAGTTSILCVIMLALSMFTFTNQKACLIFAGVFLVIAIGIAAWLDKQGWA